MALGKNNKFIWLGVIAVLLQFTILLCVMPELASRLHHSYNQEIVADGYDQLAANLAAGHGYRFYPETARTLAREPGYPLLLAGLLLVFGSGLIVVKLTNLILALITAWVTLRMAAKLSTDTLPRDTLLFASPPLLFLFHPGTLIAESRGGVEIVFACLVVLVLSSIYRAIESNHWVDYALSGFLLGVTVLVRSTPILFPFFLCMYLLVFERRTPRIVICKNISVMVVAMFIVLSPWIIRNYELAGKFIPTSSMLGVSAQAGQYIGEYLFEGKPFWLLDREAARERDRLAAQMGYQFEDGANGYYQTFYRTQDEIKFSNYLFNRVIDQYRRYPLLLVRCLGQNMFNFWFAGKTWMATAVNALLQIPYLVLAIVGVVVGLRNNESRVIGPVVLFVGYLMLVHLPILCQARYSIPLVPLLSIPCSIGLFSIRKMVLQGRMLRSSNSVGVRADLTGIREGGSAKVTGQ